jgi:serine/threonine-protein kinase
MSHERWERLQEIFHTAAALPPEKRAAYLPEACAGDADLQREVEALLVSSQDAGTLGEEIRRAASEWVEATRAGERFGPYRVIRALGRGGMGRVYLAHRDDDQFHRQVAIKVANDAQGPDDLSRFRAERQILAGLDHPNIARLLDGGTTEAGVPYLVLEYVEGEPIDVYCDAREVPLEERIRLLRTVCLAVQHAHQSLVVHRDLKPANILVSPEGIPKLLDFGIAKLLTPGALAQGPALTRGLPVPMTLEYASPEQVRSGAITTSSDVYSLGVLLYELLTGCRPLRIEGSTFTEIEKIVCEVDPEPPSAAVGWPAERAGGRSPEERARARGTTPERLHRAIRGDLDTIVLMALRKTPARRYGAAEQLAEDLRRHDEGLPVRARRSTIPYRAAKFVRRNGYALAIAAIVATLVLGFGISRARLAAAFRAQRDQAEREADTARRVETFLEDLFRLADPGEQRGASVTAREMLDLASEQVQRQFADRPEVRAELLDALGTIYRHLGLYTRAEPMLEQALALRRSVLGEESVVTAQSLMHLGELSLDQSRFAEGEPLVRRALEIRQRKLGPDDTQVAEALHVLGLAEGYQGRLDEAERSLRQALAVRQKAGVDSVVVASTLDRLAQVLEDRGDLHEAEALARRAVEILDAKVGDHPTTARSLGRLGEILRREGEFAAAEAPIRRSLDIHRKIMGPDHPMVAADLHNLANLLRDRGDASPAEAVYRESLDVGVRALGDDHLEVAATRSDLADLLAARGRYDEAERLYRDALPVERREGRAGEPAVASTLLGLGRVLLKRGAAGEAEPLLREAADLRARLLPASDPLVIAARGALGDCLVTLGRYDAAESLLLEAAASFKGSRVASTPEGRAVASALVRLYEARGNPEKAAPYRALAASR